MSKSLVYEIFSSQLRVPFVSICAHILFQHTTRWSSLRYISFLFISTNRFCLLRFRNFIRILFAFYSTFSYFYIARVYKPPSYSSYYFFLSLLSCKFYLAGSFISLAFFLLLFVSVSRMHSPGWSSSSSFSLIRLRFPYTFCLPVFPFLFPFSLYLTPLLPSYTAPSDFFSFFLILPVPCGGIFVFFYFSFSSVVLFIFPSRSTLISLFVHSTSFAPPLPLLYLFPCVSPALAQRPGPRCFSRLSTHVNARSLIFLSSLFLVRPTDARGRPRRCDIFRFSFRYVRSVSNTWSVPSRLDIVLFYYAKCILLPRSCLIRVSPSRFSNSSHSIPSPVGDLWKYDTLDSLPLPTLIRHATRESGTARSSSPANGYGRCSSERESPSQTIFS